MARRTNTLFRLLGLAFVVAGADKLRGDPGYKRLYERHWGWSEGAMKLTALAEVVGGTFMLLRWTRPLGGAVLTASSAAVLQAELKHKDTGLALPRLALLLASLAATRIR